MRLPPFAVTYAVAGVACLNRVPSAQIAFGARGTDDFGCDDQRLYRGMAEPRSRKLRKCRPSAAVRFHVGIYGVDDVVGGKSWSSNILPALCDFYVALPVSFGIRSCDSIACLQGKLQSSYVSVIRPADSGMRSLLQTTFPFLAAPLFAIFIIQLVRSLDCMLGLQRGSNRGYRKPVCRGSVNSPDSLGQSYNCP